MADDAHALEVSAPGIGTLVVRRRAGAIVADWRLDGAQPERAEGRGSDAAGAGGAGWGSTADPNGDSSADPTGGPGRRSGMAADEDLDLDPRAAPDENSTAELSRCAEAIRLALEGDESALGAIPTPRGTAFQRRVWDVARTIPRGETRTYGDVATLLGCGRGACRAIGQALRRNPLPIVVPCHRVVAAGGPGGYGGDTSGAGFAVKLALLGRESGRADFARVAGCEGPATRDPGTFVAPRTTGHGVQRCD